MGLRYTLGIGIRRVGRLPRENPPLES